MNERDIPSAAWYPSPVLARVGVPQSCPRWGYPSPVWLGYPVLGYPTWYWGTPCLGLWYPLGRTQASPSDWGTLPTDQGCGTSHQKQRPGKEPETGVPRSSGVDRQTPVKILPSPSFGCGRKILNRSNVSCRSIYSPFRAVRFWNLTDKNYCFKILLFFTSSTANKTKPDNILNCMGLMLVSDNCWSTIFTVRKMILNCFRTKGWKSFLYYHSFRHI